MKNNRSKKVVYMMTGILAAAVLAGCGASEAEKELKDMRVEKYVTLGEYKGIEVDVLPIEVDAAQVETWANEAYTRAVEMGDVINLDYSGKRDDVVFDGGTAENQSLGIGSGSFIPGFEEGLVGVLPGETVDVPLSFPEDYWNEDLAGAEVVFTVTVNYIYPADATDNMQQAMADANLTNAEDYKVFVLDYLQETAEDEREAEIQNQVMDAFIDGCEFKEFPKDVVEKYEGLVRTNIETMASRYGYETEEFVSTYYYQTVDEFVTEQAMESLKQDVAFQAVANAENLNLTDEEVTDKLMEIAAQYGLESVEDVLGENTLDDYRNYYMIQNVLTFLSENAAIKE